ncbi:MAG TPA: hypothetical protein VF021_12035 [Longimicrobiales bacterium]
MAAVANISASNQSFPVSAQAETLARLRPNPKVVLFKRFFGDDPVTTGKAGFLH